jgi:carboxymethylenebutenolidase
VVVLHDIVGLTDDTRMHVDWFAKSGYIALAPDLFHRGKKFGCIRTAFQNLSERSGDGLEDIEAARNMLISRSDCTEKVGVIGFCMGGAFALVAAVDRGFSASSVNYGNIPGDVEQLLNGACPIIGSFGAKDLPLKGAAARLEAALEKNGVPHDVKEYPDVGHAFMNVHHGVAAWILAKIGFGFNEAASSDTRMRVLKFFSEHLS